MGEESMISALQLLRASTLKNKTERLRDLYDEVETLKSCGFSHARIVETMQAHDLNFKSVQAFEVTFYRIKKERSNTHFVTCGSTSKAAIPKIVTSQEETSPERNDIENSGGLSNSRS